MLETAGSSETSLHNFQTMWRRRLEHSDRQLHEALGKLLARLSRNVPPLMENVLTAFHHYIMSWASWLRSIFLSSILLLISNSGLGRLIVEVSRSYTIRHTPSRTPLNEWWAHCVGYYPHYTQQIQETSIHALSRIRTRNPSNRAAADLRLWPHDQRDR